MTVKTKFSVGDYVYWIRDSVVSRNRILDFNIMVTAGTSVNTEYRLIVDKKSMPVEERFCFATKEDLLKSL